MVPAAPDPGSVSTCWRWIGTGGDTYLIRGSIASGKSYRVGQSGPNPNDFYGLAGNPYGLGRTAASLRDGIGAIHGSWEKTSASVRIRGHVPSCTAATACWASSLCETPRMWTLRVWI